jgi:hypothetical protein
MRRLALLAVVIHAWGIAWVPIPAMAANPPDAASASKHFERGVALVDDEDWPGALVEFERAYAIDPNYRVLFDIAQCRYQLHDYVAALQAFQRYLSEGQDAVPADRKSKVEGDIAILKGRVASLRVSSAISGAEVSIDDAVVGTTPLVAPVLVSAGLHRIVLRLAGGATVSRDVALAGEENAEVVLDPVAPPTAPSRVDSAFISVPAAGGRRAEASLLPGWIAFGAGAVGLGVGAYFGVEAIDGKRQLDTQCDGKSCPPSAQSLLIRSQRDALISTVGLAAGAVFAAGGAAYVVIARGGHSPHASPSVGFLVGPGLVGAAGTF